VKKIRHPQVLGDANRLAIIHGIGIPSRSATEITSETGLSQTLVSFHLRALREKHIVTTRLDGPFIHYRLTAPELYNLIGEPARVSGFENAVSWATPALARVNRPGRAESTWKPKARQKIIHGS